MYPGSLLISFLKHSVTVQSASVAGGSITAKFLPSVTVAAPSPAKDVGAVSLIMIGFEYLGSFVIQPFCNIILIQPTQQNE